MLCTLYYILLFFFFQAEDGIRDVAVTGVQTCALPISEAFARRKKHMHTLPESFVYSARRHPFRFAMADGQRPKLSWFAALVRSEERRVGKGVDLGGRRIIKKKKRRKRV